jgi:hypothetical protein
MTSRAPRDSHEPGIGLNGEQGTQEVDILGRSKINLSQVFAGQKAGIKEVSGLCAW